MSEPTLLFGLRAPDGSSTICAHGVDGRVVLSLQLGDGEPVSARLTAEQACGLALALLAANLDAAAKLAQLMDQRVAQEIAAALLAPTALRALLAQTPAVDA